MTEAVARWNAVTQNVILGSITGIAVGINLKILFQRIGGIDLVWILFFILGPAIGYFSGKERERIEELKEEKESLEDNLSKLEVNLRKSDTRYQLLVEHANDAIFLTTMGGKILLFNEAFALLTGFRKGELNQMNISQIRVENQNHENDQKSWFDNGFCRYEEKWKNKNGDQILLEINARWIRFGEHRLILHVARDILAERGMNEEDMIQALRFHQESRLLESAMLQKGIFTRLMQPLVNAAGVMEKMVKKHPEEKESLASSVGEITKTRTAVADLPAKVSRDLNPSLSRWNVHEIIRQEIVQAETVAGVKGVSKKVSLASGSPIVFGLGKDFSLAFGALFKAIFEAFADSNRKELLIATKAAEGQILIEIQAADVPKFNDRVCRILDPLADSKGSVRHEPGMSVFKLLFNSLDATMEVKKGDGKELFITIGIPTVSEKDKAGKTESVEGMTQEVII
jgi:PAS domain S-box-containing protein